MNKKYKEISPLVLSARMKEHNLNLIDVRTAEELTIARVDEFTHIPMHEIPSRIDEFNREEELYILCRAGHRSADVCEYLHERGFHEVYNVTGGILAWSHQVDPTLQKY